MKTPKNSSHEYRNTLLVIVWIFCLYMVVFFNIHNKTSKLKIKYGSNENNNWDQFRLVRKLSVDQLRNNKECESLTDEEAIKIIDALYKLSLITYNIDKSQNEECYIIENEINNL